MHIKAIRKKERELRKEAECGIFAPVRNDDQLTNMRRDQLIFNHVIEGVAKFFHEQKSMPSYGLTFFNQVSNLQNNQQAGFYTPRSE